MRDTPKRRYNSDAEFTIANKSQYDTYLNRGKVSDLNTNKSFLNVKQELYQPASGTRIEKKSNSLAITLPPIDSKNSSHNNVPLNFNEEDSLLAKNGLLQMGRQSRFEEMTKSLQERQFSDSRGSGMLN